MNWLPDKKILAGGISGVGAWLIMLGLAHFGVPVDPAIQAQIAGLLGLAIAYFVPPADRDIVKRLNDDLVAVAQVDPSIPVSPSGTAAAVQKMSPVKASQPPGA